MKDDFRSLPDQKISSSKTPVRRFVFASDFDDTLYFHDGRGLQKTDAEAIRRFQEAGHCFVLCTGRPAALRKDIEDLVSGQVSFDYEIYSCGSVILDRYGNRIFESPLDETFVRKAAEFAPVVPLKAHQEGAILYSGDMDQTDRGKKASSPEDFSAKPVYEISFPLDNPLSEEAVLKLKSCPEAACYENRHIADFVNRGVSKATGLDFICRIENVPFENSAAMGDSFNDLSMIKHASYGFTFPDAETSVVDQAGYIRGSLHEALEMLMALSDRPDTDLNGESDRQKVS